MRLPETGKRKYGLEVLSIMPCAQFGMGIQPVVQCHQVWCGWLLTPSPVSFRGVAEGS